ncbi:MAG: class I adenylate-forming enzyme family protein, partial [Xanthobacteraceae bacterium]
MNAGPPPADDLATGVSLDALFRSNALNRPSAIAVVDPADRARYTDGAPRRLTYAEADAEVDRLAHRLQSFALPPGSVVAIQLPNLVEAVISLLAILRAGLTAVPVPMAWRRSDLVAALGKIEPKALLTLARFGDERPAEVMCEAAVELFHLSFPCVFGTQVPDGMIALDGDDGGTETQAALRPTSISADAVAIATFDAAAGGFFACGRGHSQWLAVGLATLLEVKIESGDTIATTIPPNSLAGIGTALVPWLLSGGMLELRDGFSLGASAPGDTKRRTHLIAPAAALGEVSRRGGARLVSCAAVHRGQHARVYDFSSLPCERIVDFFTFG